MSNTSIFYNRNFSRREIESVLGPLFGDYYGLERLRSIISKSEHVWCMFDQRVQRPVAAALLSDRERGSVLYLKLFGVDKASQGQGIGTRLLKAIQQWARARRNYMSIMLHTQTNNSPAIHLYEKVGFRKEFFLRDFFHRQSNHADAYQMIFYLWSFGE